MIPKLLITEWRKNAPWIQDVQVEQDLALSKALVEMYNHPKIAESLAFRGGTALNKLFLNPAARYSEDIDVVQINPEPIGETLTAIRSVLDSWLGSPKSKLTQRSAKLIYRYQAIDETVAKLKIEINTTEHFHILPLASADYLVNSRWFEGKTSITTYKLEELMATKLCALHQRSKGRDLFDLWFVRKQNVIALDEMITLFHEFNRRANNQITRAMFEQSLAQKRQRQDFIGDTSPLLRSDIQWNFEEAFEMVMDEIVSQLPGEPWKGVRKTA